MVSAADESETVDEGAHLVAGYSYWKTNDFRLLPSHPPLAELLCAIPLLAYDLDFAPSDESWKAADEYAVAKQFLYHNKVPADTILLAGRLVTVLFTLLLGFSIALWTRTRFGAPAALFSLLIFVLDPTIAAHGRYVTTDLMVTAFLFWSVLLWLKYLETGKDGALLQTGILVGCTLATKFSGPIVYPILLAIYLLHRWRSEPRQPLQHTALELFGALAFIPFAIIFTTFFFDARSFLGDPVLGPRLVQRTSGLTRIMAQLPIPAYYYVRGVHILLRDFIGGHVTYLLGKVTNSGVWFYFPVAFAVKTPLATLSLLLMGGSLIVWRIRKRLGIPFLWIALAAPCAVYFAASVVAPMNIGVRHILPMYPFLFVLIGGIAFGESYDCMTAPVRAAACFFAAVLLIESISVYPDYLTFFNVLAGGPENGPQYLMDSNLDWGQDLKKLKRWVERHPDANLCLSYYGQANPEYYGIFAQPLPTLVTDDDISHLDCVAAVSANNLFNVREESFAALRERLPDLRIGNSIYIYDLRKRRSGTAKARLR